jgi:hypothetical protein
VLGGKVDVSVVQFQVSVETPDTGKHFATESTFEWLHVSTALHSDTFFSNNVHGVVLLVIHLVLLS